MEIPQDLYSVESLFSLTGSAAAVWIVTSVIGYLFHPRDIGRQKKWIGILLSLLLALLGATRIQNSSPLLWVVAIVNGFLIYLTAVGVNTIAAHAAGVAVDASTPGEETPIRETSAVSQTEAPMAKRKQSKFLEPWY